MISVEEALRRCLALCAPLGCEDVPLRAALGRRMATAAIARRDQPPFAASAMDGYAVAGGNAAGSSYAVIGEAGAGHGFAGALAPGEALRIFTGAPIPAGAERVVIQEDVERDGDRIIVRPGADAALHIRPAGQDFRAGDALPPRRVGPSDLALFAAMNIPRVSVHHRPVVALIATGDELVMPGEEPGPDQIIASNSFALAALVEQAGGVARLLPIAPDREAELAQAFALAEGADLVVTIGGASVGDHDLVAKVASGLGLDRAFWKIAMRPGKPLMAGRISGVPMLGLPGNPVSAIVCGHLFLLPMLRAMQGDPAPEPQPLRATLGADVGPTGNRTHYMRARVTLPEELPVITPFDRQDSALLRILSEANALLIRPLDDSARPAGSPVTYLPL